MNIDIRWKQRFNNFISAYQSLTEAVELAQTKTLSKLEQQGVIQGFEYTHELAWNLLKDYLTDLGMVGLIASKDTTREAFKRDLIDDGEIWMDMIKSRNLTSHTYNQDLAEAVFQDIVESYYVQFSKLAKKFTLLYEQE
ncbi:MAG: hypothetical protein QG673_2107 [Pseudomonadota bacterium]|nr:hypothetical protein [Pseudomonadota bacterium]